MTSYQMLLPVVLFWSDPASGVSTNFGSYFITTLPLMNYSQEVETFYILFSMCTNYNDMMEVKVDDSIKGSSVHISKEAPRVVSYTYSPTQQSFGRLNTRNYRFQSVELFGLTVYILSQHSSASFTALPVEGWGQIYYAVTLGENPTVQIVSDESVNVRITFYFADPFMVWHYRNMAIHHNLAIEIHLQRWTTLPLQNCSHPGNNDAKYGWTGTKLLGDKKFGVVSGSCYASTPTFGCNNRYSVFNRSTSDAAVEMLMPFETFGTKFIVPEFAERKALGFMILISGEPETLIYVYEGKDKTQLGLRSAGSSIERRHMQTTFINSSKGIQVFFVWHSQCARDLNRLDLEPGDVSMLTIIPTALFYYSYLWRLPDIHRNSKNDQHFFVVIFSDKTFNNIVLMMEQDFKPILSSAVPGMSSWSATSFWLRNTAVDTKPVLLVSEDKRPFGCYVYGMRMGQAFMHPAGFISSPINDICSKTLASMKPGDLIDNDCDRLVDEEKENQRDDDNDLAIDEDLLYLTDEEKKDIERQDQALGIVHGGWSEWGPWHCTGNCPSPTMIRDRLCNSPTPNNGGRDCVGESFELKTGDCYRKQLCPEDCPDYTWDIDCVGKCPQCSNPCDKKTGVCNNCKKGYKSPNTGCNIPCGYNEFGVNCQGNCTQKCGNDCFEREGGTCPIHGGWNQWGEWRCTSNCKDPRQLRERVCNRPEPELGGHYCPNSAIEYKDFTCYQNTQCQQDCPAFRWEINCTESCENCIDDCNKFNGSCLRCKKGYKFPESACLTICSANQYGENCEGNCMEKCGEDCFDKIEGVCSVHGSWSDWDSWHCTSSCRENKEIRTRGCTRPRPEKGGRNCVGEDFEMRDGSCYKGVVCSEDCPAYKWDLNCVQDCSNCRDDCNKINGSCSSCKKGFKFPHAGCSQRCEDFEYGDNCEGRCKIKCGEDCYERENGTCPVHGDWGVWTEWKCSVCPDSRMIRTRTCDNPTPNQGGRLCEGIDKEFRKSTCYKDMLYCYEDCPLKTWSLNCSKNCFNCVNECNKYTGICSKCKAGFKDPAMACSKACEENEFGENCEKSCIKKCGEDCEERVTGRCPVYGNWLHWQEWQCTRNCSDRRKIRYRVCDPPEGRNVETAICKDINFQRTSSTCYVNTHCPLDCPDFHWGTDCKNCKNCKYDCDKFNGSCIRCLPGYQSPDNGCQFECSVNYYGQDCIHKCSTICAEDCVNRVTGECPASKAYLWSLLLLLFPFIIFCSIPKDMQKKPIETRMEDSKMDGSKMEDSRMDESIMSSDFAN